jgi:hypothetical protein
VEKVFWTFDFLHSVFDIGKIASQQNIHVPTLGFGIFEGLCGEDHDVVFWYSIQ